MKELALSLAIMLGSVSGFAVSASPALASWGSVVALTLCVATLIASDLGVTEGTAGQAIAVSGLFAILTSLSISSVARGIDRRTVLLGLTLAMILSGVMVAFAPNTAVFMAGRALAGTAPDEPHGTQRTDRRWDADLLCQGC